VEAGYQVMGADSTARRPPRQPIAVIRPGSVR